jgi:trimeric autotransporter adhesin
MMKAIWLRNCAALTLPLAAALAGCRTTEVAEDAATSRVVEPPDTFAITSMDRLVSFNHAAPFISSSNKIFGLAADEKVLGLDIRPADGMIVLLTSSGRVYQMDPRVGYADLLSTLKADPTDTSKPFTGLIGSSFGVNFNPVVDRLRVVSDTGQNLRINVATGVTITDGALNVAGVNETSYTNAFGSACRTKLYYIDSDTNRLFTTMDPNRGALAPIATLDVNGTVDGFEIVTTTDGSNVGFAVASSPAATTLVNFSLSSGQVSGRQVLVGLEEGETIAAMTMLRPEIEPAQPLGELLAVTDSNRLISFTASAPQKLCTQPAQITGLQPGDQILGIDVRPADGMLYAAGSSGQIYSIRTTPDAAFATATRGPMLQTATGSAQFSSFTGSGFGIDFNPMRDKLRVVSNEGQNLRIDVDAGAVTTDVKLSPTTSKGTAAAYTNSFAGAASTTLYVIDVASRQLAIQGLRSGDPNKGDLKPVGALRITGQLQGASGFDINGRTNAAFAALNMAGPTGVSELFSINLSTGGATRVNTIGGGERVRGLAFAEFPESMRSASTQRLK